MWVCVLTETQGWQLEEWETSWLESLERLWRREFLISNLRSSGLYCTHSRLMKLREDKVI